MATFKSTAPLFYLNEDDLIISLNEKVFEMLNMVRHPDKFKKAFWSNEPMIDGFYAPTHFDVRFAAGFGWMCVSANPVQDVGWKYNDKAFFTFYDDSAFSKKMNAGQFAEFLKEHGCEVNLKVAI